ncbi:MAG TPA: alpha/beta hydrolase [Burkholderiaceae bacterium]|nr:alpha/beta hydrolase [Burkholderiaceae bacterium]
MQTVLRKAVGALAVLLRCLVVWSVFLLLLWLTHGAGGGGVAFAGAVLAAGAAWWRWRRGAAPLAAGWRGGVMLLVLAPLAYVLVPLGPAMLPPLPPDPSVQLWPTGAGRAVAVYRYAPSAKARARGVALVFVHGGPGGSVRDFDRAFFSTFADAGFDVVLYDQFGSGRSPLGDTSAYTHDGNVADLLAVLTRVNRPAVLVGQSYGAILVTSALANPEVRRRVSHVVLTEPGQLPGAAFSLNPSLSAKTTLAAAGQPASAAAAAQLFAPRAMLAAMLPPGSRFAPQEEIVGHYTAEVQRALLASAFCKGDDRLLNAWQPTRFNLLVNGPILRQAQASAAPRLHDLAAPVLLLLGECSYIPRGRAMEYFDAYAIARSHLIHGVGHIPWGNAEGQRQMRAAILSFVDGQPGPLPDEPNQSTRRQFVASGR